jgi:hypothetical protein
MALSSKPTDAERRAAEKRKKHQLLCSYPGCRKPATEIIGYVKELGAISAVCSEHRQAHTAKKDTK